MPELSQEDYVALDATEMAALVRCGALREEALLDAALARLETVNPRINAVTAIHPDYARSRIPDLLPDAAFRGVPFLIKDLFTDLAGTICENGSSFHVTEAAQANSTIVDLYERAGLIILGRTHSPEFGGTSTSESRRHGITRNPFDLARSAGGSSGGAAAAIAAGIVPAAQATDAGGSIIIPASCCGLFGMKPSRGAVPLGPGRIEGAAGLAVQHALTRSVRDSAALFELSAAGPAIPGITPSRRPGGYLEAARHPAPRRKIALIRRSVHAIEPLRECSAALEAAAALCAALGHHVEEAIFPIAAESFIEAERWLRLASITFTIANIAARLGREPRKEDFEAETWERYRAGLQITGTQILAAREHMLSSAIAMQDFMARYDFILTPSMADLPPAPGTISLDRIDEAAKIRNRRLTTFCGIYNWTGQPAMSVPLSTTEAGLPVGILLAGRHGEDDLLLRLALELEAAQPWTGLANFMRNGRA